MSDNLKNLTDLQKRVLRQREQFNRVDNLKKQFGSLVKAPLAEKGGKYERAK